MVKLDAVEADESTDPRVGATIDKRYRVIERLSSGAMGVVYRAERLQLGRQVAIKFLHPHFASQPDFSRRFEQEALTMSRLNHPHCVSVIDFGVAGGPFIVMDFVTGQTLVDLLDDGPLAPARAIHILRQILAGLAHAHEQGIIHRDIKPANIMLSNATGTGDHVHILDFGLAKLWGVDQSATGIVVGTPSYMSPEQAGLKKIDARSDVYSAGVVLFELLTGEKPFQAEGTFAIIRKHLEEPAPALRDRGPGIQFSRQLEAVVKRALAKDPDARYASALEMADALAKVPEASAERSTEAGTVGTDSTQLAPDRTPPPAPRARTASTVLARAATPAPGQPTAAAVAAAGSAAESIGGTPAPDPQPRPRRRRPSWFPWLVVAAAAGGWVYAGAPGLPQRWRTQLRTGAREAKSEIGNLRRDVAAPPTKQRPARPKTFKEARALIAAGHRDDALAVLNALRREHPRDAKVVALIGDLYIQKDWWSEGLAAYRDAIAHDAGYGDRPLIVKNAVRALGRNDVANAAETLLVKQIGPAALPALRGAARDTHSARYRSRCRRTIHEIEQFAQARRRAAEGRHP